MPQKRRRQNTEDRPARRPDKPRAAGCAKGCAQIGDEADPAVRAVPPRAGVNAAPAAKDTWVMLEYRVSAQRVDARGSLAYCKEAQILLDTGVKGRADAFNPAEMLLAALAACMIKGIERVTPMLQFELRGIDVALRGLREDTPPKIARIEYTLTVDTHESDRRLELLHQNVMKYGTVYNTLAAGTELTGRIRRASGGGR